MAIDTVVLVHGAFADGSCWAKVIPLLAKQGLKAVAAQNPLSSLADDVKAVHRVVDAQEGPVLMVGHSWGGAVIAETGNHPEVKGLVYVAAGAPDSGQSFDEWWKPYTPAPGASEIKPYGEGYVAFYSQGVRKHFVQDIPADEADIVFATQGPLAVRCFADKISKAAWRSKPSWYIVAAHDETIPPDVERNSAKRMGAETRVPRKLACPDAVSTRRRRRGDREGGGVALGWRQRGGAEAGAPSWPRRNSRRRSSGWRR